MSYPDYIQKFLLELTRLKKITQNMTLAFLATSRSYNNYDFPTNYDGRDDQRNKFPTINKVKIFFYIIMTQDVLHYVGVIQLLKVLILHWI